ncbi:MAG: hypothetical protein Unbinned2851contig1000_3 [Prokaryotic dsDNA virus sp.]|nr:MAG: hypothetical protein Unbinned2851contig1000_3 [Prokaryotic dsDNA virus sp.]|tara:strand:+ start:29372 stop:29632 length:261 start_codon:yes stop_codon:yes gene_type:complete
MIPTINFDFNEEKELSVQDVDNLIENSESYLLLTKEEDQVKIAGYASHFDALLMILNFLLKNKSVARTIFGYFVENRKELRDDICE